MREGGGYVLWSDLQMLREADVFNPLNATWGVEACVFTQRDSQNLKWKY